MFKKLGFGSGKSKKRPKKKRLSPAAHERGDDGSSMGTAPPPSYQYAMNEYALTGPSAEQRRPTTLANIDDEGQIRPSYSMTDMLEEQDVQLPLNHANVQDETTTTDSIQMHEEQQQEQQRDQQQSPSPSVGHTPEGILRTSSHMSQSDPYSSYTRRRFLSPRAEYFSFDEDDTVTTATFDDNSRLKQSAGGPGLRDRGKAEQMMPDATYEEWYGDAYVGGPIRYVYPSGYQSMRPRGGPWRLSIIVCLLFTWLSVFIIGHCSDIYNQEGNNNDDANDDDDPDNLVINEKWCGSRLLYWMWVISMLITGLASAYCGVIGYIKVRDFAVANTRSQPPGIMTVGDYSLSTYGDSRGNTKGNSDYYVPIGNSGSHPRQQNVSTTNFRLQQTHPSQYSKTIYQADGTPQFWGNQIYRPNQAAVHTVSR
mmetsp:Transcript_16434/g.41219  ORF Transcript_16434/g.41219 Transcript_16434/m.41219 type:complete len:424 (+) Transcript_16434:150-1421(+)